ncbi:unnamed protein product, partial [Discosporangium mesarthrocarpum]
APLRIHSGGLRQHNLICKNSDEQSCWVSRPSDEGALVSFEGLLAPASMDAWVNLIFPNARSLEESFVQWLANMVSCVPSSSSVSIISEFGSPLRYMVRSDDDPDYIQLLKETLVAYTPTALPNGCPHPTFAPLPRNASLQQQSSMADLIDRVIKSLVQSSSVGGQGVSAGGNIGRADDPRRNVLSLGCQAVRPHSKKMELAGLQGVECIFPNTVLNILCSPPWEQLHARIGDDLMYTLLRQHTILARLPNCCFLQASCLLNPCRPVPDTVRYLGLTTSGSTGVGGFLLAKGRPSSLPNASEAGEAGEASMACKTNNTPHIRQGQATGHGVEQMQGLPREQEKESPSAGAKTAIGTGLEAREGGGSGVGARGAPVLAGGTREGSCKRGRGAEGKRQQRVRMPPRLLQAVPLFEVVLERSKTCNFGRLLETHCPLKEGSWKARTKERGKGSAVLGPGGERMGASVRQG